MTKRVRCEYGSDSAHSGEPATKPLTDEAAFSSPVDIVRELPPLLKANTIEAERDRRLPDTVADAMRERGLYRMWRPKVFGGLELDPMTVFRIIEQISRFDSAAGWNLQLSCALDPFGAWFSDEGALETAPDEDQRADGRSKHVTARVGWVLGCWVRYDDEISEADGWHQRPSNSHRGRHCFMIGDEFHHLVAATVPMLIAL